MFKTGQYTNNINTSKSNLYSTSAHDTKTNYDCTERTNSYNTKTSSSTKQLNNDMSYKGGQHLGRQSTMDSPALSHSSSTYSAFSNRNKFAGTKHQSYDYDDNNDESNSIYHNNNDQNSYTRYGSNIGLHGDRDNIDENNYMSSSQYHDATPIKNSHNIYSTSSKSMIGKEKRSISNNNNPNISLYSNGKTSNGSIVGHGQCISPIDVRQSSEYLGIGGGNQSFWDIGQYKKTVKRIEDGYKLAHDYTTMLHERGIIEENYAKALKTWTSKWTMKLDEGAEYGTMLNAWKSCLDEAERIAKIHLAIRSQVNSEIVRQIKDWQKDNFHKTVMSLNQVKEAKDIEEMFKKIQKPWAKLYKKVTENKKMYHTACKMEKTAIVQENNSRYDMAQSPDEQKKMREKVEKCKEAVNKAKEKYLQSLKELNGSNAKYMEDMKDIFEKCQNMEESRMSFLKNMLYDLQKNLDPTQYDNIPDIYDANRHKVDSIDIPRDLSSFSNSYGVGTFMNWPIFEEYVPELHNITGKKGSKSGDMDGVVTLKSIVHKDIMVDDTNKHTPSPQLNSYSPSSYESTQASANSTRQNSYKTDLLARGSRQTDKPSNVSDKPVLRNVVNRVIASKPNDIKLRNDDTAIEDEIINKVTGRNGKISENTYAQLRHSAMDENYDPSMPTTNNYQSREKISTSNRPKSLNPTYESIQSPSSLHERQTPVSIISSSSSYSDSNHQNRIDINNQDLKKQKEKIVNSDVIDSYEQLNEQPDNIINDDKSNNYVPSSSSNHSIESDKNLTQSDNNKMPLNSPSIKDRTDDLKIPKNGSSTLDPKTSSLTSVKENSSLDEVPLESNNGSEKTILSSNNTATTMNKISSPQSPTHIPVRAIYEYEAQEDDEIGFGVGDVLIQLRGRDEQGWCYGKHLKTGAHGLYPSEFVEKL